MSLERWIQLIAGSFIVLSVALSYLHFVGFNLVQSALTRFCLMENILRKLGIKSKAD
ncbi:MAG: DUF2892 domain-containing protein [Candidatus Methylomirabilales bacterium]